MNWGYVLLRLAIVATVFSLLFLSQRFWYRSIWRMTANWGKVVFRVAVRCLYLAALVVVILAVLNGFRHGHGKFLPRGSMITVFAGLWFFSALFSYLAVITVRGLDHAWNWLRRTPALARIASRERLPNPSRRYFFQTATAAAGAAPFIGAVYGFAAERLNYRVRRVEIPVSNLPSALDGLRITQLSDIHLSAYMPRSQVRRAVDMANDLGGDLAVVTGDFITGSNDPIEDCVAELQRLRAPLGVWACNGNHEVYAGVEDITQGLFRNVGIKLLRTENAQVAFRGAQFNLIGVDYQRDRAVSGQRLPMLVGVDKLVRRDMPNILLSHNPNSFNHAAELGIELSLAGHTHGGQIQVEILDHRLSPARFITDYIAGLYQRPLFAPVPTIRSTRATPRARHISLADLHSTSMAAIYVNRGLGTVGAPVRLGVPPEITLLTLRST